jgi:hypothetical protein
MSLLCDSYKLDESQCVINWSMNSAGIKFFTEGWIKKVVTSCLKYGKCAPVLLV